MAGGRRLALRAFIAAAAVACLAAGAAAPALGSVGAGSLKKPATSRAKPSAVVVHRQIASGTYEVTVALASDGAVANHITVQVGSLAFYVTTARRHRHARISTTVDLTGPTVTIRALGSRLRPHVAVRLRRVQLLVTPNVSPAPDSGAAGSPGATATTTTATTPPAATPAPTGATGSAGGSGTTTPPPSTPSPPPQSPSTPAPTPTGVPGSWHMIFDDEFNASFVNMSFWSNGLWGFDGPLDPSEEQECYPPSQVTEGGGELDLTAIAKSGSCTISGGSVTKPYQSGMISTQGKFQFTFGFIEARAFLPGSGSTITDWPGIWAAGNPPLPQGGELDIMEGLSGMACWHYHDPQGGRPGGCPAGTWTNAWHTFAADWEPGKVVWYYDGKAVGTDTQNIAASAEHLILNLAVDQTYGGPIQTPASLRIDYVRVWQH